MHELEHRLPEVTDFFLDVAERKTSRPKSAEIRNKRYSCKKSCILAKILLFAISVNVF
jgi:hypothetical protein